MNQNGRQTWENAREVEIGSYKVVTRRQQDSSKQFRHPSYDHNHQ